MSLFPTRNESISLWRVFIPLKSINFSTFYAAMRSLAVLILHNIARVSATNKKLIHEFSHLLKGQQNRISLNGPIFDRHVVVPTKNVSFLTNYVWSVNKSAGKNIDDRFSSSETSSGFHYEIIWGVAIFTDKYNVREFYQFNYILSFSGV